MVVIFGSNRCSNLKDGCRDGLSAARIKEFNCVGGAGCTDLVIHLDVIRIAVFEISCGSEKVDIPVVLTRCVRRKKDGTHGKGLEDRGDHHDSVE